jgi:ElaB/YqjD/DUF883 family membrane-anchored ribosome-binding protein
MTHTTEKTEHTTSDAIKKACSTLISDANVDELEKLQSDIHRYANDIAQKIKEHPLKAVLIAGGVGMLLSGLLKK